MHIKKIWFIKFISISFLNTSIFISSAMGTTFAKTDMQETMYISGRYLYSAAGEKVILRGINEMMIWSNDRTGIIIYPEIAKTGANCVRIVWTREGSVSTLNQSVANCLDNKMIPIVELHDATGVIDSVLALVDFWTSTAMVNMIETHKKWFLLNIANEAGDNDVTETTFVNTYKMAIDKIREAGITVPLIIDAPGWGQNETMIIKTWSELFNHDPLKRVMFSVHTYWISNQQTRIKTLIDNVVQQEIPLVFGEAPQEYGWDCESIFPWRNLIAACQENEIGWLPWSWGYVNNGNCPGKFDMTTDGVYGHWETSWGEGIVVTDVNSIQNTSVRPPSLIDPETTVPFAEKNKNRPVRFILHQNHPNPFNPSTVISWQLAIGSHVELSIFNVSGERVATLLSEKQLPGIYHIEWSTPVGMASGVYFYGIKTDTGLMEIKKMIYLR
jgi:mannan endo-1,4-beta-mannosidase